MKRFTLIELLVVIAVIAILSSLLLPSLGKARRTSQTAVSMGNMKQINMAMFMYLDDNKGRFPPGRSPVNYAWDDYISSYLGIEMTEAEKAAANPTYRASFNLLKCPLDDIPRVNGNGIPRSYQVNSYTTGGSKRTFDYSTPLYVQELPDPTATIIINEQVKSHNPVGSGSNVIMMHDTNLVEVTTGIVLSGGVQYNANHHKNGFKNPVVLADGHAEIMYMPTTTVNNNYLWNSKVY
ncbi:type II secretion system protein [Lentisphaera marina]|uniref:type II secretion system protein n=1 Tax=Lentisphaera marina TaxID=1111041 RepID=UPI002365E377|nr:type II secretion system protein [Lentisphaera marina]MDD7983347.1 type II secretion system protein [Lentisphaera marina]